MQTGIDQHKRQQLILWLKGYYTGAIDGVWSAKTIKAKLTWEADGGKFEPGYPNNGLPFQTKGPYPKGIRLGADGLLTCAEVVTYLEEETKEAKEVAAKASEEKSIADKAGTE